jgi:glycerol-3-phosphate acyltransferase PlsX
MPKSVPVFADYVPPSNRPLTIALDAMGGDKAPDMVVKGAAMAHERFPEVHFLLFGQSSQLELLLQKRKKLQDCVTIIHTDEVITGDQKPSSALRGSMNSSMRLAIRAVREGRADAAVSAGNTGALMAVGRAVLGMLPGIRRPAIASVMPTLRGECVMLDLGANVEADANTLVQHAYMGEAFARTLFGFAAPSVGLLNVGSEMQKGRDELRQAADLLQNAPDPLRFMGFVEGDDITAGAADVVVTDGFTGNIALKMAEGTARLYSGFLKQTLKSSLLAQMGYVLSRPAFRRLRLRVDPRRYNGAVLLGLRGVLVKSHGGTDALGFANAIGVGVDMVRHGFIARVRQHFEQELIDTQGLPPLISPQDSAVLESPGG